jgi:hypothetical protein
MTFDSCVPSLELQNKRNGYDEEGGGKKNDNKKVLLTRKTNRASD